MEPKRAASNYTTQIDTREEVEKMLMDLLVYVDTQLFVEKDSDLGWHKVKDSFMQGASKKI